LYSHDFSNIGKDAPTMLSLTAWPARTTLFVGLQDGGFTTGSGLPAPSPWLTSHRGAHFPTLHYAGPTVGGVGWQAERRTLYAN